VENIYGKFLLANFVGNLFPFKAMEVNKK